MARRKRKNTRRRSSRKRRQTHKRGQRVGGKRRWSQRRRRHLRRRQKLIHKLNEGREHEWGRGDIYSHPWRIYENYATTPEQAKELWMKEYHEGQRPVFSDYYERSLRGEKL